MVTSHLNLVFLLTELNCTMYARVSTILAAAAAEHRPLASEIGRLNGAIPAFHGRSEGCAGEQQGRGRQGYTQDCQAQGA